ncbi:MAG: cysteine desulfurase [Euryarchaeota archaeon]|nr:cysteine desulfurase [Euryarchaeota archaeon]
MDVERVRRDFPVFTGSADDPVYLDNACQTFRPRQVIEASDEYYLKYPACAGRSVHRLATEVSVKVDEAREKISRFIGSRSPNCIVFTKNCTEALNLVAKGLSLRRGDIVLTTDMEHNSNHVPWIQLARTKGITRKSVETPADGIFDLESFKRMMTRDVSMVSLAHTNNATGTTVPAREVIEIAHDSRALVMLDGAQYVPHMKIDVDALDVDFYAFSMHKMLGPSGVGVLYMKEELAGNLEPLIAGGGAISTATFDEVEYLPVPERFEGGLMNYSGIVGSGAAVDYLESLGMEGVAEHNAALNSLVTGGLMDIDEVSVLEPVDHRLRGGIFSFNIRGMSSHDVAMILDQMGGIMIRSGMHCTHPFFLRRGIDGCARASFYIYNTPEECERFLDAVKRIIHDFSM